MLLLFDTNLNIEIVV